MRIITRRRLLEWSRRHPDARNALATWAAATEAATWASLADVRRVFPTADGVVVASGRTVTVFNVRGNNYRLIAGVHYRGGRVYAMRFLTHAEYDDEGWKRTL